MKTNTISLTEIETKHEFHKPTIPKYPDELDPANPPDVLAIDTETTGLHWAQDDFPFAISMAWYDKGKMRTAYYDWPVDPETRVPDYQGAKGMNLFFAWYNNPDVIKVFANAKFDIHHLEKAFVFKPKGRIEDVLLMAWCCNTMEPSYKLNNLAEKYLDVDQKDAKDLRKKADSARKSVKNMGFKVGPDFSVIEEDYWLLKFLDHNDTSCRTYALKDAGVRTLDLYYFYLDGLKQLDRREAYEAELDTMHEIYRMEERGIRFHEDTCIDQLEELVDFCARLEKEIKEEFGAPDLNINSDKQLIPHIYETEIAYKTLGLTPIEFTAKGQPSMSAETLKKLVPQDASGIINKLLAYRGHDKGIKTYRNYLKYGIKDKYVTEYDMPFLHSKKAIHASFNQTSTWGNKENKTKTGRLTSSNPNIQNVADPEKSNAVVDGREMFGPRDGYVWYCIDYSQLELRLFAERTGGKLKEAFLSGRDPHNETRENVPYLASLETGKGRKIAKNTNFTIINCGGAGVLYKKYNVPLSEGKIVLSEFHHAFPETRARQKEAETFAIKNGYIETITGRKVDIDLTQKEGQYLYAYRATSYDIQGSAADIIKRAMVRCADFLRKTKYDAHLLLSIHDELIFEVLKKHSYKNLIKTLKAIMESVAQDCIDIPLFCEVQKTTTNWSSKEKKDVVLD